MKSMSRLQKVLMGVILLLIIWIAVILVIRNQRSDSAEKHVDIQMTQMSLSSEVIDFGVIELDTMIQAEFIITNDGDKPLYISDVNPDCSCTQFFLDEKVILPKDSTVLRLYVNTSDKFGPQQVNTLLTTNTEEKFHLLKVTYDRKYPSYKNNCLSLGSGVIDIGKVSLNNTLTISQFIYNYYDTALTLEIESSSPCMAIEAGTFAVSPNVSNELSIVFRPDEPGDFVNTVTIHNDKEGIDLKFDITGIVVEDNQHNSIEMSDKKLVSLIKTAARNFENIYSKDYASKYLYYKTVSSKDQYLEFVGSQGVILSCSFNQDGEVLHLLDKNSMHQWYPVCIMRSYPWDIGGERLLAYSSKRLSSNPIPKDSEYTDIPNVPTSIVDFKRTLEVYSPLNPKHIKDFDYVIKATSGDDYAIGFSSKPGISLKKTRLIGSGVIYINKKDANISKIEMEDHLDMWTVFPRKKSIPDGIETHHKLVVLYKNVGNKIYTGSVSLDVSWLDSDSSEPYAIIQSPRTNAARDGIKEAFYISFSDYVDLDDNYIESIDTSIPELGFYTLYAPYSPEDWEEFKLNNKLWPTIEKDLSSFGTPLAEQVEKAMIFNEFDALENNDYSTTEQNYLKQVNTTVSSLFPQK